MLLKLSLAFFLLNNPIMLYANVATPHCDPPKRIVSTSLASDEILFALIGASPRIVALSDMARNPQYSNIHHRLPKALPTVSSEPELILSHRPDLIVVASFNRPEMIAALEKTNIKLLKLSKFHNLNDVATNIAQVAEAICETQAGKKEVAAFNSRRQKLAKVAASKAKVLSYHPDGYVHGQNTLFDEVVTLAGATNVAATMRLKGWQKLNPEVIARLNPDLIVVAGDKGAADQIINRLKNDPIWKLLNAVKEKKVLVVPEAKFLATSHHILDAVELIQSAVAGWR